MQSFTNYKSWWSKEPHWEKDCGSFLPCSLLVNVEGIWQGRVRMCQLPIPIFSNLGPPANLLQLSSMDFQTNIGSFEFVTGLNPSMTGTCRLSGVQEIQRPISVPLHILAAHQNVVGWWFILNYMLTPPTHYFLESHERVAYM